MNTSISLLVALATLPLLAPAQTTTVGFHPPNEAGVIQGSNALSEPMPVPAMTLRSPDSRPESNAWPSYTTRGDAKREVLIENRVPPATLGSGNFPVSGLMVDAFRTAPSYQHKTSLMERVLGRRNSVVYAEEPEMKFSWPRDYLKWGESNEPWSVVSAPPPPQPQSVLFRLHY